MAPTTQSPDPSETTTTNTPGETEDVNSSLNLLESNNVTVGVDEMNTNNDESNKSDRANGWCDWWKFGGNAKAKGFSYATIGIGSIMVSNIFLATSISLLASQEAGCINPQTGRITDCTTRVYGFLPSSIVNTIYAIASLAAAFFMPLFGAIVDYRNYRRAVGRWIAFALWAIQTIQIGTISQTWFPMAVLQAIAGVLFEFHFLICVSYLPDIIRYDVSYETMNRFNRAFYGLQSGSQTLCMVFLMVTTTWIGQGWGSVKTAQLGQGLSSAILLITFPLAWTWFPKVPAKHTLPEGHSLLMAGFRQNYRTFGAIAKHHRPLKWFLITVVLAEAGISTLVPTVITLMAQIYKYNADNIGLGFLVAMVSSIPGVVFGALLSKIYNPQVSQRMNLGILTVGTLAASFVMDKLRREQTVGAGNLSYTGFLFSAMWGFLLGWFYTTQQLFFVACLPPKQEAELSGFFVYCTIILTWVPTLAGTIMLNTGIGAQWLLIPLVIFQFLSFITSLICPHWSHVQEAAKDPLRLTQLFDRSGTEPQLEEERTMSTK